MTRCEASPSAARRLRVGCEMPDSSAAPPSHALHTGWTIRLDPEQRTRGSSSWLDGLHALPAFSSVESFWALWSRLVPLSALKRGAIYVFREHTKPTWESWPDGGKWELSFAADAPAAAVDALWEALALALVGEQLWLGARPERICGAVAGVRGRGVRSLGVWTSDAEERDVATLGARLRELLRPLPPGCDELVFSPHAGARRGATRSRFTLAEDGESLVAVPSESEESES